jgi:electron transport complex protein RnfE
MNARTMTFLRGIVIENPLAIIMIGLCSSLAVTTSLANGIGMSLALTFVLVMSELIISAFRKLIPDSIRIPIFIIVIAAFTTMVDLTMKAYFPELSAAMGVFIPLIVVNCIIMGRVEAFASKQSVLDAVLDSLGMGLGYAWVLCGMSIVRELLGNGTFLGMQVMPSGYQPILFFELPPGGFLTFALFLSLNLYLKKVWLASPAGCVDGEGGAT